MDKKFTGHEISMDELPPELIVHLLRFLGSEEMGTLARVCSRFRALITEEVTVLKTGERSIEDRILGYLPGVREVHLRIFLYGNLSRSLEHLDRTLTGPLRIGVEEMTGECLKFIHRRFIRDPQLVTHIKDLHGNMLGWSGGTLTLVLVYGSSSMFLPGIFFEEADQLLSSLAEEARKLEIELPETWRGYPEEFFPSKLAYLPVFRSIMDCAKYNLEEITLNSYDSLDVLERWRFLPKLHTIRYKDFRKEGKISSCLTKEYEYLHRKTKEDIQHIFGLMVFTEEISTVLQQFPNLQELNVYTSNIPCSEHNYFPDPRPIDITEDSLTGLRSMHPLVLFREYR